MEPNFTNLPFQQLDYYIELLNKLESGTYPTELNPKNKLLLKKPTSGHLYIFKNFNQEDIKDVKDEWHWRLDTVTKNKDNIFQYRYYYYYYYYSI
jgi:adenine specific DNA methylase Mod